MSSKKETPDDKKTNVTDVTVVEVANLDETQIAALAAKLKGYKNETEVTSVYLAMEVGVQERFWYIGQEEIPAINGDGMQRAVRMINEDSEMVLAAQTMLVSNVIRLKPGTPISITYLGKEKNQKNLLYDNFRIAVLS
jgi:hypothetical protein